MLPQTEDIDCPICGTPLPVNPKRRIRHFTTVECPECTLEYVNPRPSKEQISSLYRGEEYFTSALGDVGYRNYGEEQEAIAATSRRRLLRLQMVLGPSIGAHLLEVGAAFGYFLEEAERNGIRVSALEVSDAAASRLKERFKRVFHGELQQMNLEAEFDLLVLFDTIEHIANLREFIDAAYRAVRPGGVLAFTTPDNQSLSARLAGKSWWSYRLPEHLVYLNYRSITRLLDGSFTLIHVERDRQFVSARKAVGYVGEWSRWLGNGCTRLVARAGLADLMVSVPNGMKLYVARRVP
jgi:SAM-dependent methyltransferase